MRTFSGPEALLDAVGEELGPSEWVTVDQEMINGFADVTGDHQWIHVDIGRAATGPYGTTIAHGHLTLALLVRLQNSLYRVDNRSMTLNYGLDRVRLPAPVPAGARVRARATVAGATPTVGGVQAVFATLVEVEHGGKPACAAQSVMRFLH